MVFIHYIHAAKMPDEACTYSEVFLSETSLCERSFLPLSICSTWSLQLLLRNKILRTITFTKEGFIITRHSFQDLIISGEQDSVSKLVQPWNYNRVKGEKMSS